MTWGGWNSHPGLAHMQECLVERTEPQAQFSKRGILYTSHHGWPVSQVH